MPLVHLQEGAQACVGQRFTAGPCLQIVSIAEEEDGRKTFRQKGVKDLSKADLQAVVQAAMATKDPDNRVYFTRLKERMDKCARLALT
jgi:hypothetical protein